MLADEDNFIRQRATVTLGTIGDLSVVDAFCFVRQNDEDPRVRQIAAKQLVNFTYETRMNVLLEGLGDPDEVVRSYLLKI